MQQKVFQKSEQKQNVKKACKVWNIKKAKATLGDIVCNNILFAHAVLGCDKVSSVFGIGKGASLKMLMSDNNFITHSEVFLKSDVTKKEIAVAGERAMVSLYKGRQNENLNELRYRLFCSRISTSTSYVEPRSLPPSTSAAAFHSYRVYHQIQVWNGKQFDPQEWGWNVKQGKMVPIETDKDPAPKCLLEVIRCNCKSGCTTMQCTCRKHGLA